MTAALLALVAAAMALVRYGWADGAGVRHRVAAATGWGIAVLALAWLAGRDGAWGLAIGTVGGMAAALLLVLYAGWRSPARTRRPSRDVAPIAIPRRWPDLARRLAVFVLVVPVAFVAAQGLAFGAQALARSAGAGEADAIVLALFAQPLMWSGLMAWQMTRATPARMIAPPVAAAALGAALWGLS